MKHKKSSTYRTFARSVLAVIALTFAMATAFAFGQDNPALEEAFAADQEIRSDENRAAGVFPTVQEERDRRILVMRLLAEGKIRTAEDHIRAVIILQHTTSIVLAPGLEKSMSAENRILGFFLARRAYQMGHKHGAHFMAWAFNYWLGSCGLEIAQHGYKTSNGKIVPMDASVSIQVSVEECGFDPRQYFDEVNSDSGNREDAS